MVVIKKSSTGGHVVSYIVQILQAHLAKQGFAIGRIDSDFGVKSENAVKGWQQAHGREVTGIVNDSDWEGITGLRPPSLFDRLLHIVAQFEGTGMTGVAGNFDGAFLTYGLIGFTLQHDLPDQLRDIEQAIPDKARAAFGTDKWEKLLQVSVSSESVRQAFGNQISVGRNRYKVITPWAQAFERLGKLSKVQELQITRAFKKYMIAIAIPNAKEMSAGDSLDMAVIYDLAVQNGGLNQRKRTEIREQLARSPSATGEERRKLWAEGIANSSNPRFHGDVLSRKFTMATGRGVVHGAKLDLSDWGLNLFTIANVDTLASGHLTIMPESLVDERQVLAPAALSHTVTSPAVVAQVDWREEIPVPPGLNGTLRAVNNTLMLRVFGNPRGDYDQNCRQPTNSNFKASCSFDVSIEGFSDRLWGFSKAVESLRSVMSDIKSEKSQIFAVLGHEGMGCCRFQRNSTTSISNHSWDSAIDLTINGKLDVRGNGLIQRGVLEAAPIFTGTCGTAARFLEKRTRCTWNCRAIGLRSICLTST